MEYKSEASTTVTRNITDYESKTGNIYESVVVMAKRANQISAEIKEELGEKLEEFNTSMETLEEIFENREQIELSKYYERLPKATLVATQEFIEGKVYFRNPTKEN